MFCKLFGVWPYERTLSFKSIEMYFRLVTISVNMFAITAAYTDVDGHVINRIVMVNKSVSLMFYALLILANQTMSLLNRQLTVNVIRDCIAVDQDLSRLVGKTDFKSTRLFQSGLILFTLAIHLSNLVYIIFAYRFYSSSNIKMWAIIFSNMQITVMIVMFTGLAHVLKTLFRNLNSQVRRLIQDLPLTTTSDMLIRLKDLVIIHTTLRGILRDVNSLFSLNIVLFLGYIATLSSAWLLSLLHSLESGIFTNLIFLTSVHHVFKCFALAVVLTETCHEAASEVCFPLLLSIREII